MSDDPIIVAHRRNTRAALEQTPQEYGVEVDVRSRGAQLMIHHDPYQEGECFETWLEAYSHRLLILNVKEEGLEERLLGLMQARQIEHFFFLDQSFPFLVKTALAGERRCAVRVSEFESLETAASLAGKIDWVWVDCFTRLPLDKETYQYLHEHFKICIVSPELQNFPRSMIQTFRRQLIEMPVEAVCTDYCEDWVS